MNSDFPEFDNAYKTVLVKDSTDKFEALAANANFNIYHSDIWRGTARKFAESIVLECIKISQLGSISESKLKKHFGVKE